MEYRIHFAGKMDRLQDIDVKAAGNVKTKHKNFSEIYSILYIHVNRNENRFPCVVNFCFILT